MIVIHGGIVVIALGNWQKAHTVCCYGLAPSTWSTARVADCCIGRRFYCCSWQLTKGPHSLSLLPGTIGVILLHGSSVTRWWMTKPLDCTVTTLASISLASAFAALLVNYCCVGAYAEWVVVQALHRRVSALFVCQVHLFQGAQVTVAHSPVNNKVDCCHEKFWRRAVLMVNII